jgi:hypothetical protein
MAGELLRFERENACVATAFSKISERFSAWRESFSGPSKKIPAWQQHFPGPRGTTPVRQLPTPRSARSSRYDGRVSPAKARGSPHDRVQLLSELAALQAIGQSLCFSETPSKSREKLCYPGEWLSGLTRQPSRPETPACQSLGLYQTMGRAGLFRPTWLRNRRRNRR